MNKNKHLLLWSSLGVLALLVTAAVQENFLKEWRTTQRSALAESRPIDVHLRQIIVPGLKATDRCVTCHVGMGPGESASNSSSVTQAHKPVVHDPADYGCTVCHAGQGLATDKADAHGDVHFWPAPMIPVRFASAGCGSCHAYVGIPERSQLSHARNVVERHDCLVCHRLDGRGGTLRPAGTGGMEGPDLSRVGATGWDEDWYGKHLQKTREAKDRRWTDSFGVVDEPGLDAINSYLATRVAAPRLVEAISMFHSLGCRGCHKVGGVGGNDGPDLTHEGEKDPGRIDFSRVSGEPTLANWLAEHFRLPAKIVPGSQMPVMGLDENQIELLTLYMLALRRGDFPGVYWPKDRVRTERLGEREFAVDGATLYASFCSGCHGPRGEGMRYAGMPPFPAIANPDFLAVASDEFIAATIRQGRPGRRMAAWSDAVSGLRPQEIASVVSYLRLMGNTPPPAVDIRPARWAKGNAADGARLFSTYCQGCHGDNGQGLEGPALHNKVLLGSATDTYLFETISRGRLGTAMIAFAQPSTVHPALTPAEIESIVSFIRIWEQP
jgi:cbb3-type cytochrome c oxidase subunit III